MNRVPILAVALLLNSAQPLLLGTALSIGAGAISVAGAQAQSPEAVAKVAQRITVRIEGATQGSGVLVKRDGNLYTVLTAWHVVSGQRPGEELDIYTPDGKRHPVVQGSLKRLGDVDMAILSFSSSNSYEQARVGDVKSISMGSPVFVSGFPLPTSAVPTRIFRFLKGDVIANAMVAVPNGYQLLYSNQTLPGMSGGAALNGQGQLVGIHGQGETDSKLSEQQGFAVKTGTNQAVPISYYSQYSVGAAVVASSSQATTADDYLAQAKVLLGRKGSEHEVIRLASQALAIQQSPDAYFFRAYSKYDLGKREEAITDLNLAIAINPKDANAYNNRANAKAALGDKYAAITDYNQAITINPEFALAFYNRGSVRDELGDMQGAITDLNKAIAINPRYAPAYVNLGAVKADLGDKRGAITEYNKAIALNSQYAHAYYNRGNARADLGDKQGAISDYNKSISIDPQDPRSYNNRGTAKADLGDKQGAISDYNKSISIDPQNPKSYNNRGNAKADSGDNPGAIADYNMAIKLNPNYANAYVNRAATWQKLRNISQMCADFKVATRLGNSSALKYYAKLCQ